MPFYVQQANATVATDNSSHIVPSGDDGWWQPRVAVRRMMQTIGAFLKLSCSGKVPVRRPLDGVVNGLGSGAIGARVFVTSRPVP